MNLGNCPKCGRLMVKGLKNICPNCLQEIEDQYQLCLKYLRENRQCSLVELSEATGVSVGQITKFIREGRISIANHPNMSYECEVCGATIREGNLCESCRVRLTRDINHLKTVERQRAESSAPSESVYLKNRNKFK